MLSVFGLGFFRGSTSAIFWVFLSFYSSQVPFLENYSAIELSRPID